MSKIQEMRELLHVLVQSIHNWAPTYHYKLTGDTPESLSRLLDLDEAAMHHLLQKCGLFDEISNKYQFRGVVDQHDMFSPCMILSFAIISYSLEKGRNINTKYFYLTVGKDNKNKLRLPRNQYGTTPSPGNNKQRKIHRLEILPPTAVI